MRIYLVRHGESIANANGIVQGQLDFDLTKKGENQAQKLAKRLKKYSFDYIYTSPLKRAHRTAKAINHYHNKQLLTDNRIKEISNGVQQGRSSHTLPQNLYNQYRKNPDFKFEKGESMNEVIIRVKEFYEELIQNHYGHDILIVAHGGVIRAFMALIHNKEQLNDREYETLRKEWVSYNTSLFEIDVTNPQTPQLITKNCKKHLLE